MVSKITTVAALRHLGGILCHGCFDLLHIGHIRHLQHAKAMGSRLTVTITADSFIRKGPGRPVFSAEIRAECLAALECVDHVSIVEESTAISVIQTLRPFLYVKGCEYEGQGGVAELERMEVEAIGGMMAYTPRWCSSTSLIERLLA
jgi:rfaE bifunctional protein nucleotidyltransferase chain/domain